MNTFVNPSFAAKYPTVLKEYENANKLLEMNMEVPALTCTRVALENLVKAFCKQSGLNTYEDDATITLTMMTDALKESEILTEVEASVLHKTRILCNKGAHPGEEPPTTEDAQEAIELLANALSFLAEKDDEYISVQKREENNRPLNNSDYYSPKRRYRGEWSTCYTHEDLSAIPEYVSLKRRADEHDISAMLDLAVGFMHRAPVWSSNQLVCMPKFFDRGREFYNENALDARYYYWIIRACDTAIAYADQGITYPKKYMANAFMEAIKFALSMPSDDIRLYVSGVEYGNNASEDQPVYGNQYHLVKELYGINLVTFYENSFRWVKELLSLVNEAGTYEVISELHYKEAHETSLKYLGYCFACVQYIHELLSDKGADMAECVIDENMAMYPEDIDATITFDLLQKRTPSCLADSGYIQGYKKVLEKLVQEANYQNDHPTLSAVKNAICRVAEIPLINRLISEVSLIPNIIALGILSAASYQQLNVALLLLAMCAVATLTFVGKQMQTFVDSILVPEGAGHSMNRGIVKLLGKLTTVLLFIFFFLTLSSYHTVAAKIIIVAAFAVCSLNLAKNFLGRIWEYNFGKKE